MSIDQGERRDVIQGEIPDQMKGLVEQDQILRNEDGTFATLPGRGQVRGDEIIGDEIVAVGKAEIAAGGGGTTGIARQSERAVVRFDYLHAVERSEIELVEDSDGRRVRAIEDRYQLTRYAVRLRIIGRFLQRQKRPTEVFAFPVKRKDD